MFSVRKRSANVAAATIDVLCANETFEANDLRVKATATTTNAFIS
ncbi:hypothetical protein ACIQXF_03435 [Lysinibacillus sp. NPDC097231]